MDLEEFYAKIGGSYEGILLRISRKEAIVHFLKCFKTDVAYEELIQAIDEKDREKAYEFAHRLKGTVINLSLVKLGRIVSELVEQLRSKNTIIDDQLVRQLKLCYEETMVYIDQLVEGGEGHGRSCAKS
ncbi:hypothetical protein P261_00468 [Lachnospiraceae bacterium TWA4]|nr:hypothetical protein P261_00468 [Lachnospiraceae bacterium TWA4]